MTRYRIEVVYEGRRWCDIIVEDSSAETIVQDLQSRLPAEDGYRHSVFRERETQRIVEVSDRSRVLGVTYSRTPVDFSQERALDSEDGKAS